MNFTRTVTYYNRATGETEQAIVDFDVDEERLARELGVKAARDNGTGKARALEGAVVAEVRRGSKRIVP